MLKIGSLFTGIGAWERALDYMGVPYDLEFFCERDKFAIQSYCAIHGESAEKNIGDITCVDPSTVPEVDMLVYSPPCQAFSVAGKMLGVEDKRGVLFFDALKIIEAKKPMVAIMENVKGLTTKKFKDTFDSMLSELDRVGYNSHWKVLNLKHYGLPQNRERVFVVSIRKDIAAEFTFPKPYDNGLRLKDLLEEEVDEKYYISQDKVDKLLAQVKGKEVSNTVRASGRGSIDRHQWDMVAVPIKEATKKGYAVAEEGDSINVQFPGSKTRRGRVGKGVAQTIETSCNQAVMQVGTLDIKGNEQIRRVYSEEGVSPTLNTMQGGNRQPKVLTHTFKQTVKVRKHQVDIEGLKKCLREHKQMNNKQIAQILDIKQTTVEHWFRNDNCFSIPEAEIWYRLKSLLGIKTDKFDKSITEFEEREGVYEKSERCYGAEGLAPTLTTTTEKVLLDYRIRKLTPRECWRLQGFSDRDVDQCIAAGVSNTQLYKQAGNSIGVTLLVDLYKEVFKALMSKYN